MKKCMTLAALIAFVTTLAPFSAQACDAAAVANARELNRALQSGVIYGTASMNDVFSAGKRLLDTQYCAGELTKAEYCDQSIGLQEQINESAMVSLKDRSISNPGDDRAQAHFNDKDNILIRFKRSRMSPAFSNLSAFASSRISLSMRSIVD